MRKKSNMVELFRDILPTDLDMIKDVFMNQYNRVLYLYENTKDIENEITIEDFGESHINFSIIFDKTNGLSKFKENLRVKLNKEMNLEIVEEGEKSLYVIISSI